MAYGSKGNRVQRLVQYVLSDGHIRSAWESSNPALLEAQRVVEDPLYGYVALDAEHPQVATPFETLAAEWQIVDEVVTAKTLLTITATPNPFDADGVTVCVITVDPFVACTVRVDGTPYALTIEDPALELTSDVPRLFHVQLESMATHYADAITVEAV